MNRRRPLHLNDMIAVFNQLTRSGYFSFKAVGIENIPQVSDQKIIYASNHSGWMALDAVVIGRGLSEAGLPIEESPRCVIEDFLYKLPGLKNYINNTWAISKTDFKNYNIPAQTKRIGIFPEGSAGTCKSILQAYHMKPWKPGLVRSLIQLRATLVPIVLIGAEESLPSLMPISMFKKITGTVLPLPALPFPLPQKFEVHFFSPIRFDHYDLKLSKNSLEIDRISKTLQKDHQQRIDLLTRDRWIKKISDRAQAIL